MAHLASSKGAAMWARMPQLAGAGRAGRLRLVTVGSFKVRPYTVRQGDTLMTIAAKREVKLDDLMRLNHDLCSENLKAGQTILLPAGKLSARDREILAGIGPGTYRTYPVRAGETLDDIISKRNITRAELEALNPGVNLNKLSEHQLLKLPANKYTVREREMLIGTVGVPAEFFTPNQGLERTILIGLGVSAVAFWLWRQKRDEE